MKSAALRLIEAWQSNQRRPRGMCLRTPTCSAYAHEAISRRGLAVGGAMAAWRVLTCNPCLVRRPR